MAPKHTSSSSSNNCYGEAIARRANVLASCYVVDSESTFLKGFHYSTTGADGLPSPPSSPPLAAYANELDIAPKNVNKIRDVDGGPVRQGGQTATYTIREKCERLFCETLKNVFLGEREGFGKGYFGSVTDLDLDVETHSEKENHILHDEIIEHGMVTAWFEVWDYVGGASFRGFVAGEGSERCLFTFFDASVVGQDLKQGLMALIELASSAFECEQLVICLDRDIAEGDSKALMKSLRWVGFELVTLEMWSKGRTIPTSDKWLLLGMEL